MTRDGDLFFFYNEFRAHITLRTFPSTYLPWGYPNRQVTGNTKASTIPWNYFLLQMRNVEGWAKRCNAAICAHNRRTLGWHSAVGAIPMASWHRTGPWHLTCCSHWHCPHASAQWGRSCSLIVEHPLLFPFHHVNLSQHPLLTFLQVSLAS